MMFDLRLQQPGIAKPRLVDFLARAGDRNDVVGQTSEFLLGLFLLGLGRQDGFDHTQARILDSRLLGFLFHHYWKSGFQNYDVYSLQIIQHCQVL